MIRRKPLARKRVKARRTTSPRCKSQRCNKRATVEQMCITHAERLADRLFSLWVRNRDGVCTGVGVFETACIGPLQAAHIIGRLNYAVRFDRHNCWALCAAHHMMVDQHKALHEKTRWATALLGDAPLAELMRRAALIKQRAEAAEEALAWLRVAS